MWAKFSLLAAKEVVIQNGNFSPLAVPEVVPLATSGTARDENSVRMTMIFIQWKNLQSPKSIIDPAKSNKSIPHMCAYCVAFYGELFLPNSDCVVQRGSPCRERDTSHIVHG